MLRHLIGRRPAYRPLNPPVRMDNLDASENAFFGQALEIVKAQTYDRKLPQFKARQFIPLDPTIDRAAESMIVRSYDMVGSARLLASYADDLPRADVKSTEQRVQFRPIAPPTATTCSRFVRPRRRTWRSTRRRRWPRAAPSSR